MRTKKEQATPLCKLILMPVSLFFVKLVMISFAPAKSPGMSQTLYVSQGLFCENWLSHTVSLQSI